MSNPFAACCGTPLVATYLFSGAEWFCVECRSTRGLLNVPERLEYSSAAKAESEENRQRFRAIAKDFIPFGCRLDGCAKCESGEDHRDHITDEEREASDEAVRRLLDRSEVL